MRPSIPENGLVEAAAEHGLFVGMSWYIPGMALAIIYSTLAYRQVAAF